jgi:hypothetical protein
LTVYDAAVQQRDIAVVRQRFVRGSKVINALLGVRDKSERLPVVNGTMPMVLTEMFPNILRWTKY